jgi:SAM-dependent methyltransferase
MTDARARYYDAAYTYRPANELVFAEVVRWLRRCHVPAAKRVLDVGAGYGYFINQFPAEERFAVDVDPRFQERLASGVRGVVSSAADIAKHFAARSLDLVFASNVVEHLTHEEGASFIRAARELLAPDGALVLLQPNYRYAYRRYFDDYTHRAVYDHESLAQLLTACGFSRVEAVAKFLPYTSRGVSGLPLPLRTMVRVYLMLPELLRPFAGQMLLVARA